MAVILTTKTLVLLIFVNIILPLMFLPIQLGISFDMITQDSEKSFFQSWLKYSIILHLCQHVFLICKIFFIFVTFMHISWGKNPSILLQLVLLQHSSKALFIKFCGCLYLFSRKIHGCINMFFICKTTLLYLTHLL